MSTSTKYSNSIMKSKKLPFLQSQILDYFYLKIFENKQPLIDEISELTGYPKDSKILLNAIELLDKKGFIQKIDAFSFKISEDKRKFFDETIERLKGRKLSYNYEWIEQIDKPSNDQISLFNRCDSISDLNSYNIVHQWYDYLEDFPHHLLEESINKYDLKKGDVALDPFCGSGTTLVSSNLFGLNAIGIDANPLMCCVSEVKTTWDIDCHILRQTFKSTALKFLDIAQDIDDYAFKNDFLDIMPKKEPFFNVFCKKIIQVYKDLGLIQSFDTYGKTVIYNKSATEASSFIDEDSVDFIITSPPYPNDLEYTRQTRLELYLLGFVKNMDDVQKVKKTMIKGSTKLIYRDDSYSDYVKHFKSIQEVSERVANALSDKNWGFDYPRMIKEYFGGMYIALKEFYKVMKKGSYNLQVVGDQTYKNIVIPVGKIFVEMANDIGYSDAHIELFRTRRSTTHEIPLPEEIVVIKK